MTLRNSFPDAFSRRLLSTMMRLLFLLLAFSDHFWQSPSQSGSSPNDISPSSLPLGLRIGNHPILGQSSAVISAIPAKFTNNFVGAFLVEGSRPDQWGKLSMKSRTSLEEAERNRNLLFQMADVSGSPAELREKRRGLSDEKTKANSKKERPRKSGPNSGSAERKGQVKVMTGQFTDHQEQVTAAMTVSSSPAPSSTGKKSAEHRRKAERSASKEQKPSKSTTSKRPSDGGGAAVIVGHPNVTALSSHPHRHRKGQVQAQGQKRGGAGGGGRPPNWHELTSTEQSIAMMLRCQDLESRELLPSAVSCRNLRSDKVCNYLFHEVDRKTGRRDVKCNLQGIEDIAESCRKTCGICCEDINYACEDDKNGIIDCSRQLEKCHQKKWFGVLSRFCAGSCGLCAMTSCRDYDNSCRVRKTICLKPDSVDYMRENCARTCGFCVVGEDAGGGEKNKGDNRENKEKAVLVERPPLTQHRLVVPECTDKASNCSTNAHLCGNPAHGEYMVKFCTKTCLKCNQPHTSINSRAKTTEFPAPPPLEVIIQPMLGESEGTLLTRKCRDQHEKCAQWKAEGLCKANSTFKQEQRNKCPKSCELCRE